MSPQSTRETICVCFEFLFFIFELFPAFNLVFYILVAQILCFFPFKEIESELYLF